MSYSRRKSSRKRSSKRSCPSKRRSSRKRSSRKRSSKRRSSRKSRSSKQYKSRSLYKSGYARASYLLRKLTKRDVGKIFPFVYLLNKPKPPPFWITDYRDGKLYGRKGKIGVRYSDLNKKRNKDFGNEMRIPDTARVSIDR